MTIRKNNLASLYIAKKWSGCNLPKSQLAQTYEEKKQNDDIKLTTQKKLLSELNNSSIDSEDGETFYGRHAVRAMELW